MTVADSDKRPEQVAAMFDGVAARYDMMNDLLSLGQDRVWRRAAFAALDPVPGERILDLAAGTGASTREIADVGARVVGCDISPGMLAEARRRHPDVEFRMGDALDLPFDDGEFDAVTISFGLRNVPDPGAALAEMLRVTRPGGRLLVCEFSTPARAPFAAVYRAYLARALPAIARVASSNPAAYSYLADTINTWPDQLALGRLLLRTGWRSVGYRNLTGGIVALHRARRPK